MDNGKAKDAGRGYALALAAAGAAGGEAERVILAAARAAWPESVKPDEAFALAACAVLASPGVGWPEDGESGSLAGVLAKAAPGALERLASGSCSPAGFAAAWRASGRTAAEAAGALTAVLRAVGKSTPEGGVRDRAAQLAAGAERMATLAAAAKGCMEATAASGKTLGEILARAGNPRLYGAADGVSGATHWRGGKKPTSATVLSFLDEGWKVKALNAGTWGAEASAGLRAAVERAAAAGKQDVCLSLAGAAMAVCSDGDAVAAARAAERIGSGVPDAIAAALLRGGDKTAAARVLATAGCVEPGSTRLFPVIAEKMETQSPETGDMEALAEAGELAAEKTSREGFTFVKTAGRSTALAIFIRFALKTGKGRLRGERAAGPVLAAVRAGLRLGEPLGGDAKGTLSDLLAGKTRAGLRAAAEAEEIGMETGSGIPVYGRRKNTL